MRCGDVLAAVCADVGMAHVVGEDDDEVGFCGGLWRMSGLEHAQRREQQGGARGFHEMVMNAHGLTAVPI